MNLQHERIVALCDSLNLPFVAQGLRRCDANSRPRASGLQRLPGEPAARGSRRAKRQEAKHDDPACRVPGGEDAGAVQL